MIELGLLGTETGFDIAESFAVGELSKGQTKELIPARKIFDVVMALVSIDANLRLVGRHEDHELGDTRSAKIHLLPRSKLESNRMVPRETHKIENRRNLRSPLTRVQSSSYQTDQTFLGQHKCKLQYFKPTPNR